MRHRVGVTLFPDLGRLRVVAHSAKPLSGSVSMLKSVAAAEKDMNEGGKMLTKTRFRDSALTKTGLTERTRLGATGR
jgi:hypothetical protein